MWKKKKLSDSSLEGKGSKIGALNSALDHDRQLLEPIEWMNEWRNEWIIINEVMM